MCMKFHRRFINAFTERKHNFILNLLTKARKLTWAQIRRNNYVLFDKENIIAMSLKYDTNHTTVYTIEVISNTFMEKIFKNVTFRNISQSKTIFKTHTYIYNLSKYICLRPTMAMDGPIC